MTDLATVAETRSAVRYPVAVPALSVDQPVLISPKRMDQSGSTKVRIFAFSFGTLAQPITPGYLKHDPCLEISKSITSQCQSAVDPALARSYNERSYRLSEKIESHSRFLVPFDDEPDYGGDEGFAVPQYQPQEHSNAVLDLTSLPVRTQRLSAMPDLTEDWD